MDAEAAAAKPTLNIEVIELPFAPHQEDGSPHTLADLVASLGLSATGKAVVHGVEPAANTPLQWMSEHLSYPDNILHIVWMLGDAY